MIQRACTVCGTAFTTTRRGQRCCPAHEPQGRAQRSPTTQAQDGEYRRERARVLAPDARCFYCGAPATQVDHVVAVANGGTHHGNLVPACEPCNKSKGARATPSVTRRGLTGSDGRPEPRAARAPLTTRDARPTRLK